jgi:predicted acetyltransferase
MVELIAATQTDDAVLANLLELYVHDFSEFLNVEIGDDGRFNYPIRPYWTEPNHYAFLAKVDGKLAGFALVRQTTGRLTSDLVWDMAEFFVLRNYRRHGVGRQLAHEVWGRFQGNWQIRVLHTNLPAQKFWASAVSSFTGCEITPAPATTGQPFIFSFQSS